MENVIEGLDELDKARRMAELVKLACSGEGEDFNAIATGATAVLDHIDRASALFQIAPKY